MTANLLLLIGAVLGAGGVLLLRLSWARPKRSTAMNAGGWLAMLLAIILGAGAYGAWGMAVVTLVTILASFVLLSDVWLRSSDQQRVRKETALGRSGAAPPLRIGGRFLTFLIAGPLAILAALSFALGLRSLVAMGSADESNLNVLVLFTMPMTWASLCLILLFMQRRKRQFLLLGGLLAISLPLVLLQGSIA